MRGKLLLLKWTLEGPPQHDLSYSAYTIASYGEPGKSRIISSSARSSETEGKKKGGFLAVHLTFGKMKFCPF